MSLRTVVIDDEQAEILEDLGKEMLRNRDDRAFKVLAISLAYKFATPSRFACDIDESAGMAEIVDIRERLAAYSKKVS